MKKQPEYLTLRQTAKLGIVSEYALRLMDARGELPVIHVGNRTYVNKEDFIEQMRHVKAKSPMT